MECPDCGKKVKSTWIYKSKYLCYCCYCKYRKPIQIQKKVNSDLQLTVYVNLTPLQMAKVNLKAMQKRISKTKYVKKLILMDIGEKST